MTIQDNKCKSRINYNETISVWPMPPCNFFGWNLNTVNFLGDYEAICKMTLGREQHPRWGGLMKKKLEKSRNTVPFTYNLTLFGVCPFSIKSNRVHYTVIVAICERLYCPVRGRKMTNNCLHTVNPLYFLQTSFVHTFTLYFSFTICIHTTMRSDFILKNRILITHQK
jgi:hypothetical protein